jgi:hypothetical protein
LARLGLTLAATTLIVAAFGCGGSSSEPQPEVIGTVKATASPTPTPAPTAQPATATVSAARSATSTPTPTPTPTPSGSPSPLNRAPAFPQTQFKSVQTAYTKDAHDKITGAVSTLVAPAATDLDDDQLTYSWSVTTGTITNVGLTGTWVRAIADDQEAPGKVTVTASDGRGGVASFVADFQ